MEILERIKPKNIKEKLDIRRRRKIEALAPAVGVLLSKHGKLGDHGLGEYRYRYWELTRKTFLDTYRVKITIGVEQPVKFDDLHITECGQDIPTVTSFSTISENGRGANSMHNAIALGYLKSFHEMLINVEQQKIQQTEEWRQI